MRFGSGFASEKFLSEATCTEGTTIPLKGGIFQNDEYKKIQSQGIRVPT